jgi:hypothetical protein
VIVYSEMESSRTKVAMVYFQELLKMLHVEIVLRESLCLGQDMNQQQQQNAGAFSL